MFGIPYDTDIKIKVYDSMEKKFEKQSQIKDLVFIDETGRIRGNQKFLKICYNINIEESDDK